MSTRHRLLVVSTVAIFATWATAQDKSEPLPRSATVRLGNRPAIRAIAPLTGMLVHSNGKQIITSDKKGLSVWDIETGGLVSSSPAPAKKPFKVGNSDPSSRISVHRAQGDLTLAADGKSVILSHRELQRPREFFRYNLPLDSSRTPDVIDENTSPDATVAMASVPGALFSLSVGGRLDELRGRTRRLEIPPVRGQRLSLAAGRDVVAFSGGNGIRIWDVANKKDLGEFDVDAVRALAVSANGKILVASVVAAQPRVEGEPGRVVAWSIPDRRQISRSGDSSTFLAASSDGKIIASLRRPGGISLHDTQGKHLKDIGESSVRYQFLEFLKDDSALVAGSASGDVHVWDVATGKQRHEKTGHSAEVTGVHVLENGDILTAGADGFIRVWAASGKERRRFQCEERGINAFLVSENGKTAFTAGGVTEPRVRAWDVAKGQHLREYAQDRNASLSPTSLSTDGKTLAVGFLGSGIHLLETETFKPLGTLKSGSAGLLLGSAPYDVAFAAGGRVVSREDGYYIWDSSKVSLVKKIDSSISNLGQDGRHPRISVSPDGRLFAAPVAGRLGKPTLGVWKTDTGAKAEYLELPNASAIYTVRHHPDGTTIAVGDADGRIWLVDSVLKSEPIRLEGHVGPVTALAFSKDGRKLVSGGNDTTAIVWNLPAR